MTPQVLLLYSGFILISFYNLYQNSAEPTRFEVAMLLF